jgi:hypothetical protein
MIRRTLRSGSGVRTAAPARLGARVGSGNRPRTGSRPRPDVVSFEAAGVPPHRSGSANLMHAKMLEQIDILHET